MSPVHRSPYCAIRIVLVEEMVFVVIEYHSIRVVHPMCGWCKVEEWTVLFFSLSDCPFARAAEKEKNRKTV